MADLDALLFTDFVHSDRGPGLRAKTEEDIHPTYVQILVEWTELMIGITLSADCADDPLDREFLHPNEFSIDAGTRRFGNTCQPLALN
jgi:hypothetical protein